MDRRIGALACLGLSVIIGGSGCKSAHPEVPPGSTYDTGGRKLLGSLGGSSTTPSGPGGFNSDPNPNTMAGVNFGRNAMGNGGNANGQYPPSYNQSQTSPGVGGMGSNMPGAGAPPTGSAGDPTAGMPPFNPPNGPTYR